MYKLKYKKTIDRWFEDAEVFEKIIPSTVSLESIEEILGQFPWFELYEDDNLVCYRRAEFEVEVEGLTFYCINASELNAIGDIFPSGHWEDYDTDGFWGQH